VLISPAAPSPCDNCEAYETSANQREGDRFRHFCGGKFGDYDLAVSGLEIGDEDLVRSSVEGTAAATGSTTAGTAQAASAAAIATTAAGSASFAAATAEATAKVASSKTRECTPTAAGKGAAGCEKPAATATTGAKASSATVAAGTATGAGAVAEAAAAVRTGETALAGAGAKVNAATAATTGDDQRRVARSDHETAATPTAIQARAANGDLQDLPCRQAELATDLSAPTAGGEHTGAVPALRPEREDLI
jgi:hypothetical protein